MTDGRRVTAHFAGFYLGWLGAVPAPSVNLIRQWAHRGKIRRAGTDEWGYALYDLTDVVEYARHRGYLDAAMAAAQRGEDPC